MNTYKITTKEGEERLADATTDVAIIKRYDLATKENIGTKVERLSDDSIIVDGELKIGYCSQNSTDVLQIRRDGKWLCLHRETREEEEHDMEVYFS